MYEDDPQDKVFDVLGEAVFGAHPLGRGDHRARRGRRGHRAPSGLRRLPRRALRRRATSSSRRRARSTTTRLVALVAASPTPASGALRRRTSPLPGDLAVADALRRARTPSSTTSAWARPGSRATTIAAIALRVLDNILGGDVVLAAVPGGARARGLAYTVFSFSALYAGPVRSGCTSAHARTTSARRWRSSATSSSASAPKARPRRSSPRSKENVKGRIVLGAGVDDGADEPARLRGARRACRSSPSTRSSSASTPSRWTTSRAGRRAVRARAAERRRHRRRRGRLPPLRWSRSRAALAVA